jgi:hypothetical protein
MHASTFVLGASMLLWESVLVGAALPRDVRLMNKRIPPANPTAPWVSVDESGRPSTATPVATAVDGVATILSGAPNELTGSVFTYTEFAKVRTSTGTPPMATPTGAGGSGAFPLCRNPDGPNKPFCFPENGAELFPGRTYYSKFAWYYFASPRSSEILIPIFFSFSFCSHLGRDVFRW